jgi:S-adenosylmethionine decarboxylase
MIHYTPGLHILSTFRAGSDRLKDMDGCRELFDRLIARMGLTKTGEVYHAFDSGGYTAAICLTESHVSIHTWPEFGMATFDVFLSNFLQDNSDKVRQFYADTLAWFEGTEDAVHHLTR